MAHSVPEPASSPADAGGFAAEFERLTGRPATEAEREVARRVSSGQAASDRATWAEGLLPEALAHVAVALSESEGKRVLFVSPAADLLEHRQLRLKHRARTVALTDLAKQSGRTEGATVWATPNQIEGSVLTRAFGSSGPDVVIVEDAHAIVGDSFVFRPSMARLKDVVTRFSSAHFVVAAPARGHELRAKIAKALGLRPLSGKGGASRSVIESLVGQATPPVLRVVDDESDAIAAIIGPLPRPCLVLCSTPAQADQVYAHLEAEQVPVHRYHAALPAAERAREMVHFALPGRRAVMVAVSSFGPGSGFAGHRSEAVPEEFGHGYARRDLRSLVHLCAPCSLDQYAKELAMLGGGNATPAAHSDDGAWEDEGSTSDTPVIALMLYNPAHLALNLALLSRKRPCVSALGVAVEGLLRGQKGSLIPLSQLDPGGTTSPRSLALAVEFLADVGVVEMCGTDVRALGDVAKIREAQALLAATFEKLGDGDAPRLEEVERYALSETCRSRTLHELLGRPVVGADCGMCDVCAPEGLSAVSGRPLIQPTIETRPMKRRAPARISTTDEEPHDFETELDEEFALGADA